MDEGKLYEKVWRQYRDPKKAILKEAHGFKGKYDFSITCHIPIGGGVASKISAISRKLSGEFPGNYLVPRRYYHTTVFALGNFKKGFDRNRLHRYERVLQRVAENLTPFEIEVRGLNHFNNIVFAQVFSNGALQGLNEEISRTLRAKETLGYVPHISTLYFGSNPARLFKEMDSYRDFRFGSMVARRMELELWDLNAPNGLYAPSLINKRFEFGGRI